MVLPLTVGCSFENAFLSKRAFLVVVVEQTHRAPSSKTLVIPLGSATRCPPCCVLMLQGFVVVVALANADRHLSCPRKHELLSHTSFLYHCLPSSSFALLLMLWSFQHGQHCAFFVAVISSCGLSVEPICFCFFLWLLSHISTRNAANIIVLLSFL